MISHDLSVLADVCDRVVVMYAGRVVEAGTRRQVFGDPLHPYAARALRRVPARSATRPPATRPPGWPATRRTRASCRPGCSFARAARGRSTSAATAEPAAPDLGGRRAWPPASGWASREPWPDSVTRCWRRAGCAGRVRDPQRPRSARALDGVDLPSARGEIVALVGESGSGKTTLARTLMGLQRPSAGEVLLDGEPLDYSIRALRALPQPGADGAAGPGRVVEPATDRLRVGGRGDPAARPGDRGRTGAPRPSSSPPRCRTPGLRPPERLFLRYPHELSGGQRQRVADRRRARAAAGAAHRRRAGLLLDASIRGEILALLLKLRDELGCRRRGGHPRPRAWRGTSPTGSR